MLRFQILTLFPELFSQFSAAGLMGRGVETGALSIETLHLREFAVNKHGQVDDSPYGGGSGMILRPEPAVAAIEMAKIKDPKAKVVLLSPRGRVFNQDLARELLQYHQSTGGGFIFLSPRYEGVDERIATHFVDEEISIGDFVLMGAEVATLAIMESVSRLLPGILGNPESIVQESFSPLKQKTVVNNNSLKLLEYPQYTKPQEFRGIAVPDVLLSGNHEGIQKWRDEQAVQTTIKRRPDLLLCHPGQPSCELNVALIHFPVKNKEGKTITSSLTNLDIHDIARSAKTFGLSRYYIVHPVKTLRRLAQKIFDHWSTGYGATYNPNRGDALSMIVLVSTFDDVLLDIEQRTGQLPSLISTSAKEYSNSVSYAEMRALLHTSAKPHLLLLGTGWGLDDDILSRADYHLAPINGPSDYNHLSVRGAAAIIFDRLLG